MNPRRAIESFGSAKWEPESDGRSCIAEVRLNGEREIFHIRQTFSSTIISTVSGHLGRPPSDDELEAILRARLGELVSNGHLDDLPASLPLKLPAIDWRNVETLISSAKKGGWLR